MGSGISDITYNNFLVDLSNNQNLSSASLDFGTIPAYRFNHSPYIDAYNYLTGGDLESGFGNIWNRDGLFWN